jgi:hypothetical protein
MLPRAICRPVTSLRPMMSPVGAYNLLCLNRVVSLTSQDPARILV